MAIIPERRRLVNTYNTPNLDPTRKSRIEQRFNFKGWQLPRGAMNNKDPQSIAPLQAPPQQAPQVPMPTPEQGNPSGFFPGNRAFEPKNYEGSPLYQFQKQQGMGDLDKALAARGLTNSGAELELKQRFLTDLGARDSSEQRRYAEGDANRYMNLAENESMRRERTGNENFDRAFNLLQLQLSQSPMTSAYNAASGLADMSNQYGQRRGGQISQIYPRSFGGGGGSAPVSPYIPSGPDQSQYIIARGQQDAQNSLARNNMYNSIYNLLLGG